MLRYISKKVNERPGILPNAQDVHKKNPPKADWEDKMNEEYYWKKYLSDEARCLKKRLRRWTMISLALLVPTLILAVYSKPGTMLGLIHDISLFVTAIAAALSGSIFGRYRYVLKQMRKS